MADIPDFTMKPQFPIASVISAAQQNAQLQQQARQQGQQSLLEGLQSIGQIGQTLVDHRRSMAQALALGHALGMAPEETQGMMPDQVLEAAKIKQSSIQMPQMMMMMHPELANNPGFAKYMQPHSQQQPTQLTSGTPDQGGASLISTGTDQQQQPTPPTAPPMQMPMVNKATAALASRFALANKPEKVYQYVQGKGLVEVGTKHKGDQVITSNPADTISRENSKEQDKLEQQARQGLQSVRGDISIKNVEAQRDAAITAYNRLKQIEFSGKAPNPVDYVDILGQVYKARTGTAPTDVVLRDARQQTAEGNFGKVYTFFTGNQAPATSKEIASSLKDMVAHMGLQADELHSGYMQVHGADIFPTGLEKSRADRLAKLARGKSFTEATGAKPEDYDPHVQAIKWVQDHPNDPRSGPIIQKAMQAKQGAGGQIGL